jgi:hypothetical protein
VLSKEIVNLQTEFVETEFIFGIKVFAFNRNFLGLLNFYASLIHSLCSLILDLPLLCCFLLTKKE